MDTSVGKYLRPDRFNAIPNATGSNKEWAHWKRTSMTSINLQDNNLKLEMLCEQFCLAHCL